MKERYVDLVVIRIRAGNGGDGLVHFRRERYVPRGGPDGGDGGDGGSVFLVGDSRKWNLLDLAQERVFLAGDGGKGKPKGMRGKKGRDVLIRVPLGTVAVDDTTGELLGEITKDGQRLMVARGGRGGRGNARFATPTDRAPQKAEMGTEGEERFLRLELKSLGDVGIVGLPNAGKSSLLVALTRSRAVVGAYPFTTKRPNLGTLELDEIRGKFTLVDIPGIIEGASRGRGMGTAFLRHIERSRVILFLLDPTQGDIYNQHELLISELKSHDPALLEKETLIAINKSDLVPGPFPSEIGGRKAIVVSALTGMGLDDLVREIARLLAI
ncbi:MAG: Obg family GTPase CgtA [candidate division WOR-3 bacterium]